MNRDQVFEIMKMSVLNADTQATGGTTCAIQTFAKIFGYKANNALDNMTLEQKDVANQVVKTLWGSLTKNKLHPEEIKNLILETIKLDKQTEYTLIDEAKLANNLQLCLSKKSETANKSETKQSTKNAIANKKATVTNNPTKSNITINSDDMDYRAYVIQELNLLFGYEGEVSTRIFCRDQKISLRDKINITSRIMDRVVCTLGADKAGAKLGGINSLYLPLSTINPVLNVCKEMLGFGVEFALGSYQDVYTKTSEFSETITTKTLKVDAVRFIDNDSEKVITNSISCDDPVLRLLEKVIENCTSALTIAQAGPAIGKIMQLLGSCISYKQRYLLRLALGIGGVCIDDGEAERLFADMEDILNSLKSDTGSNTVLPNEQKTSHDESNEALEEMRTRLAQAEQNLQALKEAQPQTKETPKTTEAPHEQKTSHVQSFY